MNSDDWKKIKEILADAAEIDGAARSAFLDETCPPDVRAKVDDLLASANTNAGLLDGDASALADSILKPDRTGERIGPYEITGELGAGGMGVVYLARRADGSFDQTVALKLIKRGMDSDAILSRFVNERQILASLEHPNIAHLIDGGTTEDGLPYFVMEHVEGEAINRYAEQQNLDLDARLDLFRQVCSAVSFAHQNLVIHRDLKPSNILITNDGKVKLLDFGIAKLLKTDDDLQTATQNFVFTPEYASPEQVRGEQLTTSTDIYSLGVILYELL
ncbi:MAG: serine/threonine-protein kinase, partial [Pyrinomonadaceae bacterium]